MKRRLPIGEPRVYMNKVDVLYPGEQASVSLPLDGSQELVVYLVEPMPGWYGAFLRWRWRLFYRWFPGRHVALKVEARVNATEDE